MAEKRRPSVDTRDRFVWHGESALARRTCGNQDIALSGCVGILYRKHHVDPRGSCGDPVSDRHRANVPGLTYSIGLPDTHFQVAFVSSNEFVAGENLQYADRAGTVSRQFQGPRRSWAPDMRIGLSPLLVLATTKESHRPPCCSAAVGLLLPRKPKARPHLSRQ